MLGFHPSRLFWRRRGVRTDLLLLAAAHLLTAIGFAVLLSRPDPLRDSLLFVRYAETIALGLASDGGAVARRRRRDGLRLAQLPAALAALSLSVLLILFGSGPGSSSAKVNLGPLQPIEAIRLLLALFLAGYFARRWELLREVRGDAMRDVRLPAWINLPRGEYVLPVLVGVAAALDVLLLSEGPRSGAVPLLCLPRRVCRRARPRRHGGHRTGAPRGRLLPRLPAAGLGDARPIACGCGSRPGTTRSPAAIRSRTRSGPWRPAACSAPASASATRAICRPATPTSSSRPIGEELGAAGLVGVAGLFAVLAWRGFRIGRLAASDYGFFLATALTLFLILPALIMASGRHGRHAADRRRHAVSELRRLGHAGELRRPGAPRRDPRRPLVRPTTSSRSACPMRYLGGHARPLRARARRRRRTRPGRLAPTTTSSSRTSAMHADGGRRFEYNPRMLDLIRRLPRGTIYDRQRPAARDRRRARACGGAPGVRSAGDLDRERLSQSGRAVLSAWRQGLSPPRRRAHGQELDAPRTRPTSSATPTPGCAASTTTRPRSRRSIAQASRCTRSIVTIASWSRCCAIVTSRNTRRSSRS